METRVYEYLKDVFESAALKMAAIILVRCWALMKMVHNGIEYGRMEAIGEGFAVMQKAPFDYDLPQVARNWQNGSVIYLWADDFNLKSSLEYIPNLAT